MSELSPGEQAGVQQHRQQQPNDYARELSRVRKPGSKFFQDDIHISEGLKVAKVYGAKCVYL